MTNEWKTALQEIQEAGGKGDLSHLPLRELEIAKLIAEIWMPHYDSYWYVTQKGLDVING